jgi:hypothetical protein
MRKLAGLLARMWEKKNIYRDLYILFITASGFVRGGSGTTLTHNTE